MAGISKAKQAPGLEVRGTTSPKELVAPDPKDFYSDRYAIRKGDTLDKLAKRIGCRVADIMSLNIDVDPKKLQIGDIIMLPGVMPKGEVAQSTQSALTTPTQTKWYQIKPGDTLGQLCQKNTALINQIRALNPGINPNRLVVGSFVRIPDIDLFKKIEVKPVETRTEKATQAENALAQLDVAKKEAEAKSKSWVVSVNSVPNPKAVVAIHQLLRLSGIQGVPSGDTYTDETRKAVEKYQETRSLVIDGKIGPGVLEVFKRDFVAKQDDIAQIPHVIENRTIGLNSVVDGKIKMPVWKKSEQLNVEERALVRELQLLLRESGVTMQPLGNGVYDEATRGAVAYFQRKIMRLPHDKVDGIAGPETIQHLARVQRDFLVSLEHVLKQEGGFTNDPSDSGGPTYRGVTQDNYDRWRVKKNLEPRDVKLLTLDELRAFYREGYWNKAWCNELPSGVNCLVFDVAVNSGPAAAVRQLSRECEERGITVRDIAEYSPAEQKDLIGDVSKSRTSFYRSIANRSRSKAKFLKGWLNRVSETKGIAISMVDLDD